MRLMVSRQSGGERLATIMAVPARVGLVYDFVNSCDERCFTVHGELLVPSDELKSPSDLTRWCIERHIVDAHVRASAVEIQAAKQLRAALRDAIASSSAGEGVDGAGFESATHRFRHFVGVDAAGSLTLRSAGAGVQAALETIAAEVFMASTTGDWGRLKMCGAPDCRWIFYDGTRPGTKRWCETDVCGNRMKLRQRRRKS